MIEVRGLAKQCGGNFAVDGLTFTARPGQVTELSLAAVPSRLPLLWGCSRRSGCSG